MKLSDYYHTTDNGSFSFTRENGSQFAKCIAGDFNPLHDVQAKKFCIPGDLLFALSLAKLGVSKNMQFSFKGMIAQDVLLNFECTDEENIAVVDQDKKEYLSINCSGEKSSDIALATSLAKSYVEFSGLTFPHILVPLMAKKNAMINPARPLVIYQSMSINLNTLDFTDSTLEIEDVRLDVEGKRGSACLKFNFRDDQQRIVGKGEKIMTLSGLREFNEETMQQLVIEYDQRKQALKKNFFL
ncbi:DUF3581 family protein [Gammaproteobacteria bacterium AS21]|mgnify:CR=1 FL=1|jgi:hypothetical protein